MPGGFPGAMPGGMPGGFPGAMPGGMPGNVDFSKILNVSAIELFADLPFYIIYNSSLQCFQGHAVCSCQIFFLAR
jgi:hypothetical protein